MTKMRRQAELRESNGYFSPAGKLLQNRAGKITDTYNSWLRFYLRIAMYDNYVKNAREQDFGAG